MSTYAYEPLRAGDIRLLHLLEQDDATRATNPNNTSIEIVALPMEHAPPYECVSYAWETKSRDLRIPLLDDTSVPITPSLLTAMPSLIHASKTGYLWVDQLCIDQDNEAERSQQVAKMGAIYENAERMLVWLGDECQQFAIVQEMFRVATGAPHDPRYVIYPLFPPDHVLLDCIQWRLESAARKKLVQSGAWLNNEISHKDEYTLALRELFELPWFRRAWVLQEALSAKDMLFLLGELVIGFDTLKEIADCYPPSSPGYRAFEWILLARRQKTQGHCPSLYTFLRQIRNDTLGDCCKASDPRDMIFSLQGTHTLPLYLTPDCSLTVAEVFELAAIHCIETTDGLHHLFNLCDAGYVGSSQLDVPLPSWVPDLTRRSLRPEVFRAPRHMSACRHRRFRFRDEWNPCGELAVRGKVVDAISYIGDQAFEENISELANVPDCLHLSEMVEEIRASQMHVSGTVTEERVLNTISVSDRHIPDHGDIFDDILSAPSERPDGWPLYDTFWNAYQRQLNLTAGYLEPRRHAELDAEREARKLLSWEQYRIKFPMFQLAPEDRQYSADLGVLHGALQGVAFRRIATCADGALGLVPNTARVGDRIAIVHGCCHPVVLREAVEHGWSLVGLAYIEGYLSGQKCTWKKRDADTLVLV